MKTTLTITFEVTEEQANTIIEALEIAERVAAQKHKELIQMGITHKEVKNLWDKSCVFSVLRSECNALMNDQIDNQLK